MVNFSSFLFCFSSACVGRGGIGMGVEIVFHLTPQGYGKCFLFLKGEVSRKLAVISKPKNVCPSAETTK